MTRSSHVRIPGEDVTMIGYQRTARLLRPRPARLRCRTCGEVVTRQRATLHAYQAHGKNVPVQFMLAAFEAVS
jgi:hypothetical protein